MRRILRRREIAADGLRYPGEPLEAGTCAVLPLREWLARVAPDGRPQGAAVLLTATDAVESLTEGLTALRWIVIEFAGIGDGRGCSQARLLRERHGYEHELRARGAVKRDQLFLLARCGFDAFELDPGEDPEAARAALDSFTVAYQGGDERLVSARRRQR